MTSPKPPRRVRPIYEQDLASLFDLIVYGVTEAEAYDEELAFLDWVFKNKAQRPIRDVLDAGCGTGRFLIPMLRQGYRVTGLDRGQGVLAECRRRLRGHGLRAPLLRRNIQNLAFDRRFDAIIGMDSIICYVLDTARIVETLRRMRRALRRGGVVVLNNANVLARIQEGLNRDPQVSRHKGITVRHRETNFYDPLHSLYHIRVRGTVKRNGPKKSFEHEETIRVMTPEEMKAYLREAGFDDIAVFPTFDPENFTDVEEEYLTYVAVRGK